MSKHKSPKQTHLRVVGPGGEMSMRKVVDHPPFRTSALTYGEGVQIVEVCVIRMLQLGHAHTKSNLFQGLRGLMDLNRVSDIFHMVGFITVVERLITAKLLFPIGAEDSHEELRVTQKGAAYLRRCHKKIRIAATKIVGSPLDQIVEAVR